MRGLVIRNSILALLALGALGVSAGAVPADTKVEGTIASVGPSSVVVATQSSVHTRVVAGPDTRVISRSPARLKDVVKGDFVGVTAKKGEEGMLTAVEIHIFPTALRGKIREGQWPMETGDIMTNAVITDDVVRVSGRMLYLAYNGGTAAISVPPMTVVRRMTLVGLKNLKAGMHAIAHGTQNPDGSLAASFIIVEAPGE